MSVSLSHLSLSGRLPRRIRPISGPMQPQVCGAGPALNPRWAISDTATVSSLHVVTQDDVSSLTLLIFQRFKATRFKAPLLTRRPLTSSSSRCVCREREREEERWGQCYHHHHYLYGINRPIYSCHRGATKQTTPLHSARVSSEGGSRHAGHGGWLDGRRGLQTCEAALHRCGRVSFFLRRHM